ncbi:hypothetical protein AB0L00_36180 [Actinoallomurus sp. NPDC052308]|uniref:hypothetical protein n=1 Tax=Actinoallomurus sp. NPDC052308 TaxID=3155530 RepID=UPI0034318BC7
MKDGLRIALAVGAGYLMGRRRKMRLALTLAAAGASGRIAKNPASLVKQGTKLLNTSPEVKNLTDTVRGRLVEVGKAAAVTAASSQIDALSDRLQRRTESLLRPPTPGAVRKTEEPAEERGGYEEDERYEEEREERPRRRPAALRRPSAIRRRPRGRDLPEEPEEEDEERPGAADDEHTEDEIPDRPRGVRRRASRRAEPEDEYDEETDDRPLREAPLSGRRPPVRRTRR